MPSATRPSPCGPRLTSLATPTSFICTSALVNAVHDRRMNSELNSSSLSPLRSSKFYEVVDTAILLAKGKKVGMLQS